MKKIIKTLRIPLLIAIVILGVAFIKYNSDQAEFAWYIRHFHYVRTGLDAIKVYGEPRETEYDYDPHASEERVRYTLMHYDGFVFGISGDESDKICMISVDQPGLLPLRYGIDIGASRASVKAAYWDTPISKEGTAYYLTHKNEMAWNGIWIFPVYDENDILIQFNITDGL